jgi:hypothetical protein
MNYYAQPNYSPCPDPQPPSRQLPEYYHPPTPQFQPPDAPSFTPKAIEASNYGSYQMQQYPQYPPAYDYQVRREVSLDSGLFGFPWWLLIIPFGFFWVHHTGKR